MSLFNIINCINSEKTVSYYITVYSCEKFNLILRTDETKSKIKKKYIIITQDVRVSRGPSCGSGHYVSKLKALFPPIYEKSKKKNMNAWNQVMKLNQFCTIWMAYTTR